MTVPLAFNIHIIVQMSASEESVATSALKRPVCWDCVVHTFVTQTAQHPLVISSEVFSEWRRDSGNLRYARTRSTLIGCICLGGIFVMRFGSLYEKHVHNNMCICL
jgi:hypothetical protein